MARHVRKGDLVVVTKGDDRGQQGKVLSVIPKHGRVVVEGVNVCKKHIKPSQENPQGGVIEKEMPIHISNVSPVADGKPTRVRFQTQPDGLSCGSRPARANRWASRYARPAGNTFLDGRIDWACFVQG